MSNYIRLTKKVFDSDGEEHIVCAFYGTEMCRAIHTDSTDCVASGCKIPEIMLKHLFEYENVMEETLDENGQQCVG